MNAPGDLRIDSGGDEFPVSGPSPRLSWTLPAGWAAQHGYELETSAFPGSVTASTGKHRYVEWPWPPLASRQAVRWRVRITGPSGTSDWSAGSDFEVGLLDRDWSARWISPVELSDGTPRPAYTLSTTFRTRGTVTHARLYATALGVYEAFVNGVRAGTAELSPGSTSYTATLYAQASDVTAALADGENTLQVVLSDGWFRGLTGAFREPATWGTQTAARLELYLRYTDGSTQVVRSDPGWTSSTGPIRRADLMDGQTTDFTAAPSPAVPVLVDAVTAPPIEWSPAPPVRRVAQLPARTVRTLSNGAYVVDFGQNASGWITLRDLGPAGCRTVIEHGEHLDAAGDLTTAHLDSQGGDRATVFVQRDEVVSDGVPGRVFEPRHTVHGFRYARVTRDAPLSASDLVMQVVHTDLRRTATFACSDDDLNRLHEAAEWSFRGNVVDVPTDCPTRERSGWTGDYDGRTTGHTQAGYVRALSFALIPDALRDRAAQHLVDLVRAGGMHLGTGFLATADLLPVLADTGHADVAYAVLRQRTSPSWLGMLDRGATTIWEDWDGVDEHGVATASLNHYSKGAVVAFLHTHTLGLRQAPDSVAWESFVVAPVTDDALRSARGTFDSPQGPIAVAWELIDGELVIDVEVPAGSTATLVFPDGHTVRTGPGHVTERRPAPVPHG